MQLNLTHLDILVTTSVYIKISHPSSAAHCSSLVFRFLVSCLLIHDCAPELVLRQLVVLVVFPHKLHELAVHVQEAAVLIGLGDLAVERANIELHEIRHCVERCAHCAGAETPGGGLYIWRGGDCKRT